MKLFYAVSVTCVSVLFNLNSSAQIVLESSDVADIGDVITRYIDTIPSYGPGAEGAGQHWDYSSAVVEDTAITNVSAVASTPYASTFSSSSYAMHGADPSYLYFTENNQQMITDGAAGDLLGTGEILEVPFSDPLVLHNFPREFGDTSDDTYAFQAEADGAAFNVYAIRLTHNGHVYDTTDAYGTLVTPFGSYDAIRVKTVDFTTDVIETKIASFLPWTTFSTEIDTAVSYSWHAKEEKLAIAEMSLDSVGNPSQFTFSTVPPVTTVGFNEIAEDDILVYPQPANDVITVDGVSDLSNSNVEIISIEGRSIRNFTVQSNRVDVSNLSSGVYLLRFDSAGSTSPIIQKVIIAR